MKKFAQLRRHVALWICPELRHAGIIGYYFGGPSFGVTGSSPIGGYVDPTTIKEPEKSRA